MLTFIMCLVVVGGAIAGVVRVLDLGEVFAGTASDQPATAPRQRRRERPRRPKVPAVPRARPERTRRERVRPARPAREPAEYGPVRRALGLVSFVTMLGVVVAGVFGGALLLLDVALRHAAK